MTTRFSQSGEDEDAARRRYDESKRTETSARQTNVNFAWVRRQLPTAPTPSSLRARFADRDSKGLQPAHGGSAMAGGVDGGSLGHFGFREGLENGLLCAIAGVPESESVVDGDGSSTSSHSSWSERGQLDVLYSSN